jgi:hypothetical protein
MNIEFYFQLSRGDSEAWVLDQAAPTNPDTNTKPADPECICELFIGFKSSNQIFHQMWIRSNNHETGYEQSEMLREGFTLSHGMDYNSKKGKKHIHSL